MTSYMLACASVPFYEWHTFKGKIIFSPWAKQLLSLYIDLFLLDVNCTDWGNG